MGLLNFLKSKKAENVSSDNGVPGPTYLDGFTINIEHPKRLHSFEWRRQLVSTSGHKLFHILYYGTLHNTFKSLIVGTEFAPALVVAKEVSTGQEIVIFDGCKQGFNAMFCDEYSIDQITGREANKLYIDKFGNHCFEVIISAFYQVDFEDEVKYLADENGLVTLIDQTKLGTENAKRNAFDFLGILLISKDGKEVEVVSEELA